MFSTRSLLPIALLVGAAACDRATAVVPPPTALPSVEHVRAEYRSFRPGTEWPWHHPTRCIDYAGVRGEFDSLATYLVTMADASDSLNRYSVRLEFDAQKRLLYYQDSRNMAWRPGEARGPHTSVQISTGLGKTHAIRGGTATVFRFRGAALTRVHLQADAEAMWRHPALDVERLYDRAMERCAPGGGFTSGFESLP